MRIARYAAGLITAVVGLSGFAPAVAHAAGSAGAPDVPAVKITRGAGLSKVSCPNVKFCLAVGSHTGPAGGRHSLAEEWNGKSWRILPNPPGTAMTDVSCTSATFCLGITGGVGLDSNARTTFQVWNGHAWRSTALPVGRTSEISCGGPKFCATVRDGDEIETWNGKNWRTWTSQTDICDMGYPTANCALYEVVCTSATFCMTVGYTDINEDTAQESMAFIWSGKSWDSPGAEPGDLFTSVGCAGSDFCMVGDFHQAWTWDGGFTWQDATPGTGCGTNCQVSDPTSCTSSDFCMVLNPMVWNGSTWTATTYPAVTGTKVHLSSLSCGSSKSCLAVGGYTRNSRTWTLADFWNGTAWKTTKMPVTG